MNEVKNETFKCLYRQLNTKEEERDIYRIVKVRVRKIRHLTQIRCIKDKYIRVLVNDDDIKKIFSLAF